MSLPDPNLDDLHFQRQLVDEARMLVARRCPELTNFNLSNVLATLIELQAWNTQLQTYRMNQWPEKAYMRLLNMLGQTLEPPVAAQTEITFYLSAPFPIDPDMPRSDFAVIDADTEVATIRNIAEQPEIIFTTDERRVIRVPEVVGVFRKGEPGKNYWPLEHYQPDQGALNRRRLCTESFNPHVQSWRNYQNDLSVDPGRFGPRTQ